MLRYSDVKSFLNSGLTTLGYGTAGHPAMPAFDPGPPAIEAVWKLSPNAIVVLTVGNGIGMKTEGLYDQPFIVVRVIGPQGNDYDTAETLAQDIDRLFNAVENGALGTTRTLYVTRNAPPQLVDLDTSDRYHFQTTYITETKR